MTVPFSMRRGGRIGWAVALLLLAILSVPTYRYLADGDAAFGQVTSPDKRYTLEFRRASRWQRWTHQGADMLGYVRLHDRDGETVASPVFEMSGAGEVYWSKTGVQVGTIAIYDHNRAAWSVDW